MLETANRHPSFDRPAVGGACSALVSQAVRAAKAGDGSAFHFLYVRFADDLQRYLQTIVRNREDAEDLTQDVFAKLPRAIGKYEQRNTSFAGWLFRVARNAALDHLRAKREVPVADVRENEPDENHGRDRIGALKSGLQGLPDDQREVLVLRHLVGLSPGEIAGSLGRSEASVHGLHHRARTAMRGGTLKELGSAPVIVR